MVMNTSRLNYFTHRAGCKGAGKIKIKEKINIDVPIEIFVGGDYKVIFEP
jgi:hypothetical protein